MNKAKWITIFITIIMLTTSCTNTQNKNQEVPKEQEKQVETPIEPTKGGEMVLSIRTPKTLNPLLNEEYTVDQALKLIFDTLVDFDDTQKPKPNLASKWSFSEDGTILTINLRSDVKWHDGTPFTADDVVFSFDTIKKAPDSSAYKKCIENITGYKAVDEQTVKVFYNQPFSGAVYALYFPIIPKHIYGAQVETNGEIKPIGTGAYQLEEYTKSKELDLKENPNWFKGEPYIERIKVVVTPDEDTDLYSFEQGQMDLIATDEVDWEKYAEKETTTIHEYATSYYDFVGLNFKKSLFQDKKIRKAIAYGIDRQKILENEYLNHGIITDVPINPESWLYNKNIEHYNLDTEKAKQLLGEAGWTDSDEDGVLDKLNNGNKADLTFNLLVASGNEQRTAVANDISNMLKDIGIKVQIEEVSQEEFINRLQSKNFDAFVGGWKLSPIPDYTFAFHSSQIEAGTNYISYKSDEMDRLIHQAFVTVGEENMKASYDQLQEYISEELPYISLYFRTAALITNERIRGEINPQKEFYIGNIKDWFIYEKPKEENSDSTTNQ